MTLRVDGLSIFRDGHRLLSDVSMAVDAGELVGLIGPNGAGKSTLLRALAGLHREALTRVQIDGQPLANLKSRERARRIASLQQDAEVHWPLAAAEVVALGRYPHGGARADDPAVQAAMEAVDVQRFAGQSMNTLSAGERVRVHIARALAVGAPYLLADEPVAALDPYHQLECMELLCNQRTQGRGVVVVLHDLILAARFCDRLVLLHEGAIATQGLPRDVLRDDILGEVYRIDVMRQVPEAVEVVLPWRRRP